MEKVQDISFQDKTKNCSLKCDMCSNFLSIPPILHNDTLGNICGRRTCNELAMSEGTNYRQSSYEALAKFQSFPCMYRANGCQELLPWDEIEEHERICEFISFPCPFSTNRFQQSENEDCSWTSNTTTFLNHLEENHLEHKFDGYLQFDLQNDVKNELLFSRIQGSFVIILVVSDEKRSFHCKVWSGPEIWRNIGYKIEISSPQSEPLIVSKLHKAALIDATISNDAINSSWSQIDLDNISTFLGVPKLLNIEFYFDGFLMQAPRQVQINPISSLLDNNKCDSCQKKLSQHVYICKKSDHTICETCSSGSNATTSSNPNSIWGMTSEFKFTPLSNSYDSVSNNCLLEKGASNSFSSKQLVNKCPLCSTTDLFRNLAFENFKNAFDKSFKKCKLCSEKIVCLSSHLTISHKESIRKLDTFYSDFNSNNHVYSFDDNIFLLSKTFTESDNLEISVECLESREIKYKYELKVMNSRNLCSTITFGNFCKPEYIDASSLNIPLSFLRNILPYARNLDFKLSISKI